MIPKFYNDFLNSLTTQDLKREARKQHRLNSVLTIYAASLSIVVALGLIFMWIFS